MLKYDLILNNVSIIDGSGAAPFKGALAVSDGHIARIWRQSLPALDDLSLAGEVIDGMGLTLSPGFIDIHSHSDTTIMNVPAAESRILQGITTEFGGNCGISAAPCDPAHKEDLLYYLRENFRASDFAWQSMEEYLTYIESCSPSVNIGSFVGHGSLRIAAMGFKSDAPSKEEMAHMKTLLKEALEAGAFGLSSGLIYPPGSYAKAAELEELAAMLPDYDAIYATHMRNEGLDLAASVKEAIHLAESSHAFVEISHHKEFRKEMWGSAVHETIALMKEARSRGVKIAFDQYPYRATASSLDTNVSSWAFEGGREKFLERMRDPKSRSRLREESNASHVGRWQDVYVAYAHGQENKWAVGKNILEIAEMTGKDPADACFDLILDTNGLVNEVNYGMCEEDIEYIMSQNFGVIGSDGEAMSLDHDGIPHPRVFGTFPRVLAHYCRKRKLFPLEKAIHKMTGMPAERMGLKDRGLIREGMWADLVLFDPDEICDTPSYENPRQPCSGIERVYVNGILTALKGRHTGTRAGQVLRHIRAD